MCFFDCKCKSLNILAFLSEFRAYINTIIWFYHFFIFSVLSNSISLGMYHVFWHLLTLRFWIFYDFTLYLIFG